MAEQKNKVLQYLQGQLENANAALKFYEDTPIQDTDIEIKKMREIERIKLLQKQQDLITYISVIKFL